MITLRNCLLLSITALLGTACSLGVDIKGQVELPSLGTPAANTTAFITKWKTDEPMISGLNLGLTDKQIQLPLDPAGTYDFTVDWGDGSTDHIQSWNAAEKLHTYAAVGTYTVSIEGTFSQFRMADIFASAVYAEAQKIVDVVQWGSNKWQTMDGMFALAITLPGFSATDIPDLSQCTSMQGMFIYAMAFDDTLSNWNTHYVTDMSYMFMNANIFNQPLNFDTSSVTNTASMFQSAWAFNSSLVLTDTSQVTNMAGMFAGATVFNQSLSFNTINVNDMTGMFLSASAYNQTLTFDTTNVTSCTNFSQPLTFTQCTP